jgi:transposase-like protein
MGERMATSKLTEQIVREARLRYAPRDKRNGAAALAREFGVTTNNMAKALSGETWKHVDVMPIHPTPRLYTLPRLSDDDIAAIRLLYSEGARVCALARQYGVSHPLISRIVHDKKRAA